jgi:hypothetical protein
MNPRSKRVLVVLAMALPGFIGKAAVTGASDAEAKQQLTELENVWTTAELNHDVATLHRLLDDRFLHTRPSGVTIDKETFIKNVTTGATDPTRTQTLTDGNFLIDGDTAVVMETDTVRWMKEGKEMAKAYRITVTYIRRSGVWKPLAEHISSIPGG